MAVPMILAFNLDAAAQKVLGGICNSLRLRLKCVPVEGFAMPLGAMIGLPVSAPPAVAGENFTEPMVVMCHLDEAQFNTFLQALRFSALPRIDLKAVLTPTNVAWNACQLYAELSREREAFLRSRKK